MKSIFPILFLLIPSFCFSQENESWLSLKFKNADSVLLISHEDTQGVAIVDDAGNRIPLPELIIKGKPNYEIIKERQIISGKRLDRLVQILNRPLENRIIEVGKCFIPHHTIFLFKNGKLSYIDVCFWCRGFETSEDLNKICRFDDRKWDELEKLFTGLGFKYKLKLSSF
ncbi:MAG TPA: hypothetical protein VG101_13060 [Puia sp.]|jgi:hypothetical protein|nr:hypothetical protein [Puia sp.]